MLCHQMSGEELKGRKNGVSSGFYVYADGKETPNPAMDKMAAIPGFDRSWSAEMIQNRLMSVMRTEAKRAVDEGVVKSEDEADLALILGAGFPAFRGGLLREGAKKG
jgi:3-hydroxyacyl-CoA dehydrogenase